jgi:hypothetical protein
MTKPKLLTEPEATELLDRLAPDWPLLLYDGVVIDHVLKVINNARRPRRRHATLSNPPRSPPISLAGWSAAENGLRAAAIVACVCSPRIRTGPSEEAGMIALTLVRVIERHSDELATELVAKLETSPRTADLRKVPVEELRGRIEEILRHLSEWLLTKTGHEIEQRYFELGERRASQGVALSDFCWAIAVTKEHLWDFLQRQGFMSSPLQIYGEMELLRLLDQFFDRALCFAAEGYEQHMHLQNSSESRVRARWFRLG